MLRRLRGWSATSNRFQPAFATGSRDFGDSYDTAAVTDLPLNGWLDPSGDFQYSVIVGVRTSRSYRYVACGRAVQHLQSVQLPVDLPARQKARAVESERDAGHNTRLITKCSQYRGVSV